MPMTTEWYQLTTEAVAKELGSDPVVGLPAEEVAKRLVEYGPNELVEKPGKSRWEILREQLTGFLTLVLIGAAVISLALGEYLDSIVILIIVVLNAVLGYTQEYRAEQAMAALKRMAVPTVRVRSRRQAAGSAGERADVGRHGCAGDRQCRAR